MVTSLTRGIRVQVEPAYLPDQSDPVLDRYAFAYRVTISNESDAPVQLLARHWFIEDGDKQVREVRGAGVVGDQPVIGPGEAHRYTSGAILEHPTGSMHGTYTMARQDGTRFEADIPRFELAMPRTLH